jgi:hypothetical protein
MSTPHASSEQSIPTFVTEPHYPVDVRYPGKGIGYDWRAVLAAVEAARLDEELAELAVPAE